MLIRLVGEFDGSFPPGQGALPGKQRGGEQVAVELNDIPGHPVPDGSVLRPVGFHQIFQLVTKRGKPVPSLFMRDFSDLFPEMRRDQTRFFEALGQDADGGVHSSDNRRRRDG